MRVATFVTLSMLVASTACHKALKPEAFLTKAIKGDNSEIALGNMAVQRGGPRVRAFGQALFADHQAARAAAAKVATNYNVQVPSDVLHEAAEEASKLERLSG